MCVTVWKSRKVILVWSVWHIQLFTSSDLFQFWAFCFKVTYRYDPTKYIAVGLYLLVAFFLHSHSKVVSVILGPRNSQRQENIMCPSFSTTKWHFMDPCRDVFRFFPPQKCLRAQLAQLHSRPGARWVLQAFCPQVDCQNGDLNTESLIRVIFTADESPKLISALTTL